MLFVLYEVKIDNKYTCKKKAEDEYTLRLSVKTNIRREHKMNTPYAFFLNKSPQRGGEGG